MKSERRPPALGVLLLALVLAVARPPGASALQLLQLDSVFVP